MENGKHKIDTTNKTVTFGHKTKTTDGYVSLTTTFDFSKVSIDRLLYDAASARLIKWRASSGVKDLTTAEAEEKLQDKVVDCNAEVPKEKHIETEEEKRFKELIARALKRGKNFKDIAKMVEDELDMGEDSTPETE